ncbi:hypothetical protein SAMN04487846_0158 [Microbacterium sp. cf046]|uniref:hypothetical protein n=1 Tax=Microbacterium sp. cf046 TaxID=1761803 RepID=UPI0008ED74BB|nr:hypothetical protein [Microbacterium sp. cf046]SFR87428.1 hypothetical protein SAMN04487846_0158 [Microbacterium sp. cf046]
MSTDQPTRASRSRKRRGRAFLGAFAVVVAALAVVGLAGAAAGVAQGPRVTAVQVDPDAAASASGSRVIVTTSQALAEVDPSQVTVSPAAPFTVDTSGRNVGVRFTLPLFDDTEYSVTFADVQGVGGGPSSTFTETFRTPAAELFILQRTTSGDTIYRTDLTGAEAVPVFSDEHIEDFRATSSHLVVSVRADDQAKLTVTDLDGRGQRELVLPGDGYVTNLQSADRGELIGYTFSDADLDETGGLESVLFTASLKESEADAEPTQVAVTGAEPRVAEWRFVPDTDSILLLAFDGSLLLTGSSGQDATALGSAVAIEGIARGSSQAIVKRVDGMSVIDLADASESPLVTPDVDLGLQGDITPMPGSGTVRIGAPTDESGIPVGTTVAAVADDGGTDVLMELPASDVALQTCVSPSGRYVAVLVAPDAVANPYDGYQLPLPGQVESRVVEIATGTEVVSLHGFDLSWCQVPPR